MAVADALISKVVDMLVSTIQQEFKLVTGVEEEIEKLTSSLQSVQAVLVDAERRQWKEATTVQLWLGRLKHIAYDIDDVVDKWSYKILISKIERDENTPKPMWKVLRFNLVSSCYCFPKAVLRHRMAVTINKLNARLNVIAIEKDRYGFQSLWSNNGQVEHNITTSNIDISEVKGRELDKEKLVSMLLGGSSSNMSKLRLIPVVGMGGIGKTTLARLVYNDERVKSHFHKRIWVCVSDPFDEIRIAKEILESLEGVNSNLVSLPNIMEKIQESFVEGKDHLFVLDDVWNEDPRKWKQLEDCLKGSSSNSQILVTTRNENVGRIMGCLESNIFRVGLLSEEESWELFCMIAFSMRSMEESACLEEIGKEFVRRCKGLPLNVRTIAGLLQFRKHRAEWQSALDSELWNLEEVKRDIVGPLWLSYYDLSSPLKQCFSYFAIFPKDYEVKKPKLIRRWIAQGYIKGTTSKDVEMIGDEYFQNLVMRSLLQKSSVHRRRFKMHDIVHDFAQLLVKKECLTIEVDDDSETISVDDSLRNLRHLHIRFRGKISFHESFYNLKNLRSLIISWPGVRGCRLYIQSVLPKIINKFNFLRSLILSYCGLSKVPSNINRLIHLRELDLSSNLWLDELPDTIWELYNLEILDLGSTTIKSIKGIGRLTNLKHLVVPKGDFLLPKEMVRLSGLRRLRMVCIDLDNPETFSLKHLKNFNQLHGSLEIKWLKRCVGDVEDAKQANLQDKKYITELGLCFDREVTDQEWRKKQDEELVEALNVPPNLETLLIDFYLGLRSPTWLDSLIAVKVVYLLDWRLCEHLPNGFGKLPCLKELRLYGFASVKKLGAEFWGIDNMMLPSSSTVAPLFPKLQSLKLREFLSLEEWEDVDRDVSIMPSLVYLNVESFPNLKGYLPNFLDKTAWHKDIKL